MQNPDDDFWNEVGAEAQNETNDQLGDFPQTNEPAGHINFEVLPIQELRKRAEKLSVPGWDYLNKQKLIDEIRIKMGNDLSNP